MHLYMSGTPRNDPYQSVENRMNTHRLFSMHGEYEKQVMRWLEDIKSGILDAKQYLLAYPQHVDLIKNRDARRREAQADYGRSVDWDTAEVLETVCQKLDGRPFPRAILLDSGAFTAWNKGEVTTVDDVKRKYSKFIDMAGDTFEEIWGINLDVIPGEKGRDPTLDELKRATEVSDINFEILVKEFGDIILPVYHQGESVERLRENVAQVDGKSNYICISPRNDLAEGYRVKWSRDAHAELTRNYPHIMTHGLATTGNKMVRTVPWYSGDSAAWVQHGGYGMIDIFHDEDHSFGKKKDPHYMNYFVSFEDVRYDLSGSCVNRDGELVEVSSLGLSPDSKMADVAAALKAAGVHEDAFPFAGRSLERVPVIDSKGVPVLDDGVQRFEMKTVGGHMHDAGKSYSVLPAEQQAYIRSRVEALGFPFEIAIWDSRVRNLICMAEFVTFAEWAKTSTKDAGQTYLLGDL